MSLLNRYLAREFIRLFSICLVGATVLYMLIDLFDRIDGFIRHGASAKWILLFLLYKAPLMVYQVVPATMLLSVLLTLGLMTRHNEILALRTSGIPVIRIAIPFVGMAVLASLGAFLLGEFVVPYAYPRALYIRRVLLEGKVPHSLMVRDRIWFRGEDEIYNIASFLPAKKELQGVTIFMIDRPFRLKERIDASRARWIDGRWVFYDVTVRRFRSGRLVETAHEAEAVIALPETPEDFQIVRQETEEMPLRKLRQYLKKIEAEGYDVTPYRVELHKKIAFPVLNVITAFLGIPFALRLPRVGGLAAVIGFSLILGFLYWVLFAIMVSIGQAGLLPPFLAAWGANILFGALGIYLLLRVEEQAVK